MKNNYFPLAMNWSQLPSSTLLPPPDGQVVNAYSHHLVLHFLSISKVNSTSEELTELFPSPGRYSFLKINLIENPAVKNPKDFEYQATF